MNIWNNAVITEQGLALEAKLIAGNTLTITKAQSGSGTVSVSDLATQTAVTNPVQTLNFRTVSYPETGEAAVPVYLVNDTLTTGYTATQIGIFADDPDDGEILYFIAQADSGTGTTVPSNTEMPGYTAEWTFYFTYGQADSVTVTVDPSNTVSESEVATMISNATSPINQEIEDINETLLDKADVVHVHAASDITSGVLAVARGGTGNGSVDTTPTSGSTKMVTSGGLYTALNAKQKTITSGTAAPSGGSNGDIYIQYTS